MPVFKILVIIRTKQKFLLSFNKKIKKKTVN
jgi:hypothetical protein